MIMADEKGLVAPCSWQSMVSAARFSSFLTRFGMLPGGSAATAFTCCVTAPGGQNYPYMA